MNKTLEKGLLLFWGLWFAIATSSNLFDGLKQLGYVDPDWKFASGNFNDVSQALGIYGLSHSWIIAIFAVIIFWEALSAILFLTAAWAIKNKQAITHAFTISIALWATFILMSEIFIFYKYEMKHFVLLLAELVSLLIINLEAK